MAYANGNGIGNDEYKATFAGTGFDLSFGIDAMDGTAERAAQPAAVFDNDMDPMTEWYGEGYGAGAEAAGMAAIPDGPDSDPWSPYADDPAGDGEDSFPGIADMEWGSDAYVTAAPADDSVLAIAKAEAHDFIEEWYEEARLSGKLRPLPRMERRDAVKAVADGVHKRLKPMFDSLGYDDPYDDPAYLEMIFSLCEAYCDDPEYAYA
jgi:hypothetical protein